MAPPDRKRWPSAVLGGLFVVLGALLGFRSKTIKASAGKSAPPSPARDSKPRSGSAESETLGYEVRDAKPSVLSIVMVVAVLIIAGSIAGLFTMIGRFRAADLRTPLRTSQQLAVITPPGPPLQSHPFVDIAAQRKREEELLHSYAWVDAAHTRARIPIDRAVRLVIGTSLDPAAAPDGTP